MNKKMFFKWSALAALFSIPFGAKKFLYSFWGAPSEVSSAFFYLTDFFVAAALVGFLIFQKKRGIDKVEKALFGALLFFSVYSVVFAGTLPAAVYAFSRLAFAMLFGMVLAFALREGAVRPKSAYMALSISAILQAIIGSLQFFSGKALGLRFLGESSIFNDMAHVTVQGTEYLRAYGTMPHANILAAFLGLGAIALFGWWFSVHSGAGIREKTLFVAGFFTLFFGITATFSRSGWLALALAFIILLVLLFIKKKKKEFFDVATPVVIALALVVISMQWAISPRAHLSASEPSVSLRVLYNDIGITMFMEKPLGVGIGNQLTNAIGSGVFQSFGITNRADFQPIHNLYLLIAVELGAQGIVIFLATLGYAAATASMRMRRSAEVIVPISMLSFFAAFGLFDHFFWTLEAGRLMFWVVLGIVMGISRPRGITDRTPPSEGGDRGSIPLGGTH